MTGGRAKLSGECEGFRAEQLEELVLEFGSVFADGATGTTDIVKMKIDTKDADPIAQPPYSVPLSMREPVREEIRSLEKAGIITRSNSSWRHL